MATEGKDEVERTATEPEVEQPEGENGNDPYADMTMRKAVLGIIGGLSKIALKLILILALAGGAIYGVLYGVGYLGAKAIESAAPGESDDETDDVQAFRDALESELSPSQRFRPTAPLPEGMETVDWPPAKIVVPAGSPQPIATRQGWTYTIPAEWTNVHDGFIGWSTESYGAVAYGSAGSLKSTTCNHTDIAFSGSAGRNGESLEDAARAEIRIAEHAYTKAGHPQPVVTYSDLQTFEIDGHPAVRTSAHVTNITDDECDISAANFEIVAVPGFSDAEVAVFIVHTKEIPGEKLDARISDEVLSTIRPS
ncbi:hypothetical protein G4H71_07805 [Rhodococcus triatomae]|nr:hypothetical protein [Rhodococcus triatomae]QNG17376.1 hypothetical protein G4H72_00240 [Rhodococcus triatomae]QNG22957.1 hypothetical protein G4H71_07805 [Rhodococcus triatomae]